MIQTQFQIVFLYKFVVEDAESPRLYFLFLSILKVIKASASRHRQLTLFQLLKHRDQRLVSFDPSHEKRKKNLEHFPANMRDTCNTTNTCTEQTA